MGVFDTVADIQWGRSAFRGAEFNRLSADRWLGANHPDTETRYANRPLRAASRDVVRNNPYAAGMAEAFADNITGWEGIRCKPLAPTLAGDLPREVKWAIESAWGEWCEEYATVDGVETWLETERLLDKAWFMDGEVFVRRRRGWDNPHGYAVEIIDPDLLDEEYNEKRDRTGREIVQGVEVDPHGRPLAYHFWTEHPDELGFRRKRERIEASEILHWFVRYRPGQTRGFPLLAPALTRFEMADGYEEAELVAARYHASKMGFIKLTDQDAVAQYVARLSLQAEKGKGEVRRPMKMSPGTIPYLQPGEDFQGFDPTHPSDSFDPFLKTILRGIARCSGMSYLTLTGDVAEANYSSMRAGLIPERDHWQVLQAVKSRRIHRHVHRDWRSMVLLSGALDIPRALQDYRCEWHGRKWQWVDPANDLEAAEREIKLGINSRQRLASDRGRDFESVIDESQADMAYAKAAQVYVGGIDTPPASRNANGAGAGSDSSSNGNGNGGGKKPASRLAPYTD